MGGCSIFEPLAVEPLRTTTESVCSLLPVPLERCGGVVLPFANCVVFFVYSVLSFDHSLPGWKMVFRSPRRMVPPRFILDISGMEMMIGSVVCSLNSAESALGMPHTLRAYSITASCMPRQTPRKGVLVSRAHLMALIIPSVPRKPKPPGTRIPCAVQSSCHAL